MPVESSKMPVFHKNRKKLLQSAKIWATISIIQIMHRLALIEYLFGCTDKMVFTDVTWKYFEQIPFRVRAALASSKSSVPFEYEDEPFFKSYSALYAVWVDGKSQRTVADGHRVSRQKLNEWEQSFMDYGAVGFLPELSFVPIDPRLEQLIVLIKRCRPHERASHALRLAEALELPGGNLEKIRLAQRCHGYGHRMSDADMAYFQDLQHILHSVSKQRTKKASKWQPKIDPLR